MRGALFTLVLMLVSSFSFAAEFDLKASQVMWKGGKITGSFHEGQLFVKTASAAMENGALKSGAIVLDMQTFTVTDIEGKSAQRFIKHMKSSDFFDVAKYPTAQLTIKDVQRNQASAMLTIKGKTQPVTFQIRRDGNVFSGKLVFDRTKFGIIYKSGNFFKDLGDKVIKDDVEVTFRLVLKPVQ